MEETLKELKKLNREFDDISSPPKSTSSRLSILESNRRILETEKKRLVADLEKKEKEIKDTDKLILEEYTMMAGERKKKELAEYEERKKKEQLAEEKRKENVQRTKLSKAEEEQKLKDTLRGHELRLGGFLFEMEEKCWKEKSIILKNSESLLKA